MNSFNVSRNHCNNDCYDRVHVIEVVSKNQSEDRNVKIKIKELPNCMQFKIRDVHNYAFNYNSNISLEVYEEMKRQQCLEINFSEFKIHLLEMLHLVTDCRMHLKCIVNGSECKLIFYEKSKIKDLIFLILHLNMTDQSIIFEEMNNSILELQENNRNLCSQLTVLKTSQKCCEDDLKKLSAYNVQLTFSVHNQMQKLDKMMAVIFANFITTITTKVDNLETKLEKLKIDLQIVNKDSQLKSASSARILQSMENLRLESIETTEKMTELKKQNAELYAVKITNEHMICELRKSSSEKEKIISDYEKQIDELKKDLQDATIIIAQKTKANEELVQDLVQANQMLVNFNNHYDMKVKELEELQSILEQKECSLKNQTSQYNQLLEEYEEYKSNFNVANEQKLVQELTLARKKIQDLEKENREALKMNGLLSKKLSAGSLINFEKS